ncbi:hypothetical protein A2U01_0018676, partial [Trifolium medium]|nr:hypothetical protein [Trifolium medium]
EYSVAAVQYSQAPFSICLLLIPQTSNLCVHPFQLESSMQATEVCMGT